MPYLRTLLSLPAAVRTLPGDADGRVLVGTAMHEQAGATLYLEGEPAEHWYEVVSGAVRALKMDAGGRRQIVEFFLPGDLFGFDEVAGRHALAAEAAGTGGSVVIRRCRRRLNNMAAAEPRIAAWLLALAQGRVAQAHMRLLMLGQMDALERLSVFLLEMTGRLGADDTTGQQPSFSLPVMGRDIADHLGLTVETVSRCIGHLRQRGAIGVAGSRRITITNRALLRADHLGANGAPVYQAA